MELYLKPVIPIKINAHKSRKHYLESEVKEIKRLYADTPNKEIAEKLGRTARAIQLFGRVNGLKKSRHYIALKPGCFKKGHLPWNKKSKGYTGANITSFKHGHIPVNHKPLLTVSIRKSKGTPYKYIKVAEGKWELLHRYNYLRYHGPIPPKHIIAFRDGNTLNCDKDNLILMSMEDNMKRNRNYLKASESMRRLWHREKIRSHYGLKPISGFGRRMISAI